jgi:hypothetical protein
MTRSSRSALVSCLRNTRHYMCLAPVIRPDGLAPKGQEILAQGSPWVSRNKRFALKGLEMRTPSGSKVRSRFSPYLVAPSGLIRVGESWSGN